MFAVFTMYMSVRGLLLDIWDSTQSLLGLANSKGVDKSAHPRRLISAFVIHFEKYHILTSYRLNCNFVANLRS